MGQKNEPMEAIIWAVALFIFCLPSAINAQCLDTKLEDLFHNVRTELLEGSVQQAQGTLFRIQESVHCQSWKPIDHQKFSLYSAIYHHLKKDAQSAQEFFITSAPYLDLDFGTEIQGYAQSFHTMQRWPQTIYNSRFQRRTVNGVPSTDTSLLPKGVHIVQLYHRESTSPIHAQWFRITENPAPAIHLPRHPPKWPLILGGSQSIIAGFSFWMYHQKIRAMNETQDIQEYQDLKPQVQSWLIAGTGFSLIGLSMFGVYYIW